MANDKRFVSCKEAAAIAGVSRYTLRAAAEAGRLMRRRVKRTEERLLYWLPDVLAYVRRSPRAKRAKNRVS